jgi:hypothetical protein
MLIFPLIWSQRLEQKKYENGLDPKNTVNVKSIQSNCKTNIQV